MREEIKNILIYRLGSLGDTVVALPCFHLIVRAFPSATRCLLCNLTDNEKASHTQSVLGDSGLVQRYISYPVGLRNFKEIINLRQQIRSLQPEVLIYLAASRGRLKAFRDALFFKLCGIKKIIGIPYTKDLQENQWLSDKQYYEYEAHRLARCLADLGPVHLARTESWDLRLTYDERHRAEEVLNGELEEDLPFIACSVGAKVPVKDWGLENWSNLIGKLSKRFHRHYRLVLVGAEVEYSLCDVVAEPWSGKILNLCGKLTPRESAALLTKAALFIGHDSGPMHLAEAVGIPCVAIFSARNKPGAWFPYGNNHTVIYHKVDCYGCGLEVCEHHAKKCITSITVDEVYEAVVAQLVADKIRMKL